MALLKADFHIHTAEDPEDLIRYDAKQLVGMAAVQGFSILAITNHNYCAWTPYLRDYARERGICLLQGMEATIEGRHVVLLNFDFNKIGQVKRFSELEKIKERYPEGLILAPHPFYPSPVALRQVLLDHINLFDAIEWSHFYSRLINFNLKAKDIASRMNLPLVGTSDAHQTRQFGTTYTLVEAERDPDPGAVIEAIKKGRTEIVTTPLSIPTLFRINATMLFRNQILQRFNEIKGTRTADIPNHS